MAGYPNLIVTGSHSRVLRPNCLNRQTACLAGEEGRKNRTKKRSEQRQHAKNGPPAEVGIPGRKPRGVAFAEPLGSVEVANRVPDIIICADVRALWTLPGTMRRVEFVRLPNLLFGGRIPVSP